MKAVRFLGQKRVSVEEVPTPVPEEGEVLVEIKASALCRSDLSIYHGTPVLDKKEAGIVIPGHEPSGVVVEIGKGINKPYINVGDRVAIYLAVGCGSCEYCRSGYMMLCRSWKCIGFDLDGGHAEYIKVPAYNCLKLSEEVDFITGALSTDKFGTLYHAMKRSRVSGRTKVAIFGVGPMGGMGVIAAKAFGAEVIAVDVLPKRLELAHDLGADFVLDSNNYDPIKALHDVTKGKGVDVAIDCSGNPKAQHVALSSIKPFGIVVFVGENKTLTMNPSDQLIRKEAVVMGSWYFPIWEYQEILDFIINKKLNLHKVVSHTFPLAQASEAYELFDRCLTNAVLIVRE